MDFVLRLDKNAGTVSYAGIDLGGAAIIAEYRPGMEPRIIVLKVKGSNTWASIGRQEYSGTRYYVCQQLDDWNGDNERFYTCPVRILFDIPLRLTDAMLQEVRERTFHIAKAQSNS